MIFDIQKFYTQLDEHYLQHDQEATEAFLEKMMDKTRNLHDVSPIPVSCPSCVETPTVNIEYVTVCNEAACYYRGTSNWERSLELFDQALKELDHFFKRRTANYATIQLNKAGTLRLMGRLDDAILLFQEAETFFLGEETINHYALASICNNLSLVYQDQGKLPEAAERLLAALEHLSHVDHAQVLAERGTSWNNLAVLYRRMNKQEEAMDAIGQSIAILKDLDGGMNAHYPAALNTRAMLLFDAQAYQEALEAFTQALEKTEAIYGQNIDYANGCLNIAETWRRLGDEEQAKRYESLGQETRSRL